MSDALDVMTFNIRQGRALDGPNRWYKRRDLVFDVIRRHRPHVLGLQEVHPLQLSELHAEFPTYGAIAHRRYGGLVGAYAPIFFDTDRLEAGPSGDFWLAPDPDGRKVRAWDAAVNRMCTWAIFMDRRDGGRFAVMNSHLDQRGVEARLQSAELIVERMGALAHLPRLFLADLNANETSEPLKLFLDAGFRDSFRIVRPDEAPAWTFHRFQGDKAKGRLGKIDFVLCDARWRVRDAQIVRDHEGDRWPSDHYAVTASLEMTTSDAGTASLSE